MMMRIAKNIRDKRVDNSLTQQEVADKLFVTRQCISRWEPVNPASRNPNYRRVTSIR
jgi:transcriptional regulator with XRE-family HTH domain